MTKKRIKLVVLLTCISLCLAVTAGVLPSKKAISHTSTSTDTTGEFFLGVWINYAEFASLINDKTEEQYKTAVLDVITKTKSTGFNAIILHLRSHCDAFYKSDIFPLSSLIDGQLQFDPLTIFIDVAHQNGIELHGWINPYRVAKAGTKKEDLPPHSPAVELIDSGDAKVLTSGIYLLPSSEKSRSLILSGIREIVTKYAVDGIHFDDYFYPTDDIGFDKEHYSTYLSVAGQNAMPLDDFRRTNVNTLIFATKQITTEHGSVFGVSPSADTKKNYSVHFADVEYWITNSLIDYICPQLYFGFEYPNENFRFEKLCNEWDKLCADRLPIFIGLAAYKSGQTDADSDEWITHTDILSRQTNYSLKEMSFDGIIVYNFSSLYDEKGNRNTEQKALSVTLDEFN